MAPYPTSDNSVANATSPPTGTEGNGAAADNSTELMGLLLQANSLEQAGEFDKARSLYEEIIAVDGKGTWGSSAYKALEALPGGAPPLPEEEEESAESAAPTSGEPTTQLPAPEAATTATKAKKETSPAVAPVTVPARPGRSRTIVSTRSSAPWSDWSLKLKLVPVLLLAAAIPTAITAQAMVWTVEESVETAPTQAQVHLELLRDRLEVVRWLAGLLSVAAVTALGWSVASGFNRTFEELVAFTESLSRDGKPGQPPVVAGKKGLGALAKGLEGVSRHLSAERDRAFAAERQRQQETTAQKQEKERLQGQAIEMLVQIEGAREGDLTVRAAMVEGELGAIADAFNATIDSLKKLAARVNSVTADVTQGVQDSEASVRSLSAAALDQAEQLGQALDRVVEISESIGRVARSSQEAARIARQATEASRDGDAAMDRTVVSMDNIRTAVANTAKKAKRLAESAQEISQILAIVSGISEKANLLAFNASIEAARAGEQGQGFRQVADEVRGLAGQVSESARDIEQLVGSIQQETAGAIDGLEVCTAEVVNGTQLVSHTKQTLQGLTELSRDIDRYLQDISANTVEQTEASQTVNQTVEAVSQIARNTSDEARSVVEALQGLVAEVNTLAASVAQFRIQ